MRKIFHLSALICCAMLLEGCAANHCSAVGRAGIYRVSPGKEAVLSLPQSGINYLARDKKRNLYYAAAVGKKYGKKRNGAIYVIKYAANSSMEVVQSVEIPLRVPAHIALSPDRKFLYTANYSRGDVCEFALDELGFIAGKPRIAVHSGKSVLRRQRSPHPHYCGFDPQGSQLYVCDLGTDEIWIYDYLPGQGIKLPFREKLSLPPGSGPRHMVFDPSGKVFYCANELNSSVSSFVKRNGAWQLAATCPALKEGFADKIKNYPGAIKLSCDGKFLLVSNRGHDSIALFAADGKGALKLLDTVASGGSYPSDIWISDNDRQVAAANLKGSSVSWFKLDKVNQRLVPLPEKHCITQPRALID
ncbi:MAG: lactonase family protein [Lentisphaeria bacterium]|nr:lactonase family protein [Lentisphaeria bacterium]